MSVDGGMVWKRSKLCFDFLITLCGTFTKMHGPLCLSKILQAAYIGNIFSLTPRVV